MTARIGPPAQEPLTSIELGDALELYARWPTPTVIMSDGAYGIAGFPGDPPRPERLDAWYEPHVAAWARHAAPATTLWLWNTEIGWATVHPVLARHGWDYRACHVWDKGVGHIAGNANSRTLRKFPVVTEVCAQYVRRVRVESGGESVTLKEWLRREWDRAGLVLSLANEACGVRNAATRKYLTRCHLWYFPPAEMFERIARYANEHGRPEGRPYFSLDGVSPLDGDAWGRLRAKFTCEVGVTNVWREPPVAGPERVRTPGFGALHHNQKPLKLMERIVRASSEPGDVVWEPFGGLCTAAIAALRSGRRCVSAEISPEYYERARARLEEERATLVARRSPCPDEGGKADEPASCGR